MNPTVTFIVPCYKLAHLLPECIASILSQTYEDFEILIMDDCSPDNTPEVARTFTDPRVKHIRNEPNLGHLRNYNKGIGLARGKYVWLISADDCLRKPYILERYVKVMEDHPRTGYAFCPGIGLQDGQETEVQKYSWHGDQDVVFNGREFLLKLLKGNLVVAASGMVRKDCYEKISVFPLDLPFAGDWYLWAVFALHYDVAYFGEPMVNYRTHEVSMTSTLKNKDMRILVQDNLTVLWRLKREAEKVRDGSLAAKCEEALSLEYAQYVSPGKYPHYIPYEMTFQEMDESLSAFATDKREADRIRVKVYATVGDRRFELGDFAEANASYKRALLKNPLLLKTCVKYFLLRMGGLGIRILETGKTYRNA